MGLRPLSPSGLGNLAQAARGKQLKEARGILLFVGISTIFYNAYQITTLQSEVKQFFDKEVQKVQAQGMVVDQELVQKAQDQLVRFDTLITSGAIALGIVFVVFGLIIKRYPVAVTITSLVLYLGSLVVFGVLDPSNLGKGLLFKILIVIGLVIAIQAAIAYQKEEAAQLAVEPSTC